MDFNTWYQPEKEPELDVSDADAALRGFFQFCYDAGPEKCAFWFNSTKEIQDRFFEADRRLLEKPLPVPGFGLLKTPLWRSGVYQALYQPTETFTLLAGVAAEIYNRAAGPTIRSYLELINGQTSPAEPALVDPTSGLKNSPNAALTIACSDGGARGAELGRSELDAIFDQYLRVSPFFAGPSSQQEIICLGKSDRRWQFSWDRTESVLR